MSALPNRELEIVRLAQDIALGLVAKREKYSAPPVAPDGIDRALATYEEAREVAKTGSASAASGLARKEQAVEALYDIIKLDTKYIEIVANGDQGELKAFGWGPRRNKVFNEEAPGQVAALEVIEEGKSWVKLGWRQPLDGAAPTAYKVQRRKPGGEWIDVGTAFGTDLTLNGQDAGVEFEYQVLAANKFGAGIPSNIVRAVL